jgi:hypothetical protein
VLRFVPAKFLKSCDDPSMVARVDFIHRDYKFFLLNCKLRCDRELEEADVCLSDQSPLLRYHLEPGFSGEIDFAQLLNQLGSVLGEKPRYRKQCRSGPVRRSSAGRLVGWPETARGTRAGVAARRYRAPTIAGHVPA